MEDNFKKRILIYLFEGCELLELAAFTDVFGWNNIVGTKDIEIISVSHLERIKCSWGGEIIPNLVLTDDNLEFIEKSEALIIPGGFGKYNFFRDKENKIFKRLVKHFSENKKIIVAVCTAVINLLSTGYIENKKLTTYLLDNERYFKQLNNFNIIPIKEEICIDGNLFTCSGAGNSIELALILLEKLSSKENRERVKKNMFL